MSNRYKGGVISATPPTTTGGNDGVASGAWTLEQQMQAQAAGLWPNQPVFYIEDVFSTYLYTGNGSTQTITNGIDLSGKGGLVWLKNRTGGSGPHNWYTTAIGSASYLDSSQTSGLVTYQEALSTYNSDGFSLSSGAAGGNENTFTYASWTFRKQPKFFDVVTYSGSSSTQNIAHNLGSVPGCIIVKRTSGVEDWFVYHTSLGNTQYIKLNSTSAAASGFAAWNNTSPTSTQFTVLGGRTEVNAAGSDYVAYLFAHDAGGFGLTGTDNVISCGSFSGNTTVTLGYEPQWIMLKRTDAVGNWDMHDVMRGWPVSGDAARLRANLSDAESQTSQIYPNATGFSTLIGAGNYIYIAIRRGPMKVPTSGTSVYETVTSSATAGTVLTTGFPVDLQMQAFRSTTGAHRFMDRLRGVSTNSTAGSISLNSTSDAAETSTGSYSLAWNNTGFQMTTSFESTSGVFWNFRRAPSFFDEVCYTNNASGASVQVNTHNLGVRPELAITKVRNDSTYWFVGSNIGDTTFDGSYLNTSDAADIGRSYTSSSAYKGFTSTTFTVGSSSLVGAAGFNVVTYLFATCAGVSKVGSYTGTATTKQIDCGFTAGSRFVMIKRTDSTGDWYVWDSARGIIAGNDPYLLLNSTAAEVTNTDYIDTYSAGFEISSTAPAAINANGGTFIFLAIA